MCGSGQLTEWEIMRSEGKINRITSALPSGSASCTPHLQHYSRTTSKTTHFFSRYSLEEALGWKESFDQLLRSRSEYASSM